MKKKKVFALLILSAGVISLILVVTLNAQKAPKSHSSKLKGIPYYEANTKQIQETNTEQIQPTQKLRGIPYYEADQIQPEVKQEQQCLMGMPYQESNNLVGAICEKCGRIFVLDPTNIQNYQITTCPYCGQNQAINYALNRYSYDKQQSQQQAQQQQAQQEAQRKDAEATRKLQALQILTQQQEAQAARNQAFYQGLQRNNQESYNESRQRIEEGLDNMKNIFHHKRSSTNCRSNGFGGIVCDTTEY